MSHLYGLSCDKKCLTMVLNSISLEKPFKWDNGVQHQRFDDMGCTVDIAYVKQTYFTILTWYILILNSHKWHKWITSATYVMILLAWYSTLVSLIFMLIYNIHWY